MSDDHRLRHVVGSPTNQDGHGYVTAWDWDWDVDLWTPAGANITSTNMPRSLMGKDVAISSDGNRVATAATGLDSHVRVYEWSEQGAQWDQLGADFPRTSNLMSPKISLNADGSRLALGDGCRTDIPMEWNDVVSNGAHDSRRKPRRFIQ